MHVTVCTYLCVYMYVFMYIMRICVCMRVFTRATFPMGQGGAIYPPTFGSRLGGTREYIDSEIQGVHENKYVL